MIPDPTAAGFLQRCQQITGAPEGIRTPDLCLRRAALYPAELRARRGFMYRRLREAAIAGLVGILRESSYGRGQGFESLRARACRWCAGAKSQVSDYDIIATGNPSGLSDGPKK